MVEFIFELIAQFLTEVVFHGFFKGIKLSGILVLKVITLSDKPIGELKEKYAHSSKPYFLGFGITIGAICLLIRAIN